MLDKKLNSKVVIGVLLLSIIPLYYLSGGRFLLRQPPDLAFEPALIEVGRCPEETVKHITVALNNNAGTDVTVESVESSCSCTSILTASGTPLLNSVIPQRGSLPVVVSLAAGRKYGALNSSVAVRGLRPDGSKQIVVLRMTGSVYPFSGVAFSPVFAPNTIESGGVVHSVVGSRFSVTAPRPHIQKLDAAITALASSTLHIKKEKESPLPPDTWGGSEEIVRLWYSIESTAKTGPVPAYDVRFDPASLKVEILPRASSSESQDADSKVLELTFSAAPAEKGGNEAMLSATLPDTLRSMVPTIQGTPPVWEVNEGAVRCVAKVTNQEAGIVEATFLVKDISSGRKAKITLYSAR